MKTPADRARAFRARRRKGRSVWPVEVADEALASALIDAGMVDPDSTDPADYHAAAAKVLSAFAERFSVTRYATWLRREGKLDGKGDDQ